MNKNMLIALAGNWFGGFLAWLLVHYWYADWIAQGLEISRETAYSALTILLLLFVSWRSWQIVRRRDELDKLLDRWLSRLSKK